MISPDFNHLKNLLLKYNQQIKYSASTIVIAILSILVYYKFFTFELRYRFCHPNGKINDKLVYTKRIWNYRDVKILKLHLNSKYIKKHDDMVEDIVNRYLLNYKYHSSDKAVQDQIYGSIRVERLMNTKT